VHKETDFAHNSPSSARAMHPHSHVLRHLMSSLALGICLLLTGCFNGASNNTDLGSVSIGQQLIDLKKARDSASITNAEYEKAKATLLLLLDNVDNAEDCEDADDRGGQNQEKEQRKKQRKANNDDDDSSGFLF